MVIPDWRRIIKRSVLDDWRDRLKILKTLGLFERFSIFCFRLWNALRQTDIDIVNAADPYEKRTLIHQKKLINDIVKEVGC